ncbi:MAG: ABC transporter ATP-binding protein [Candidatus Aminicenantia bacterium]
MEGFSKLFRLVLPYRLVLIFSLLSMFMVAIFTYLFVNLVQPIMDELFTLGSRTIPQKTRVMDVIFNLFHLSKEDLIVALPIILVIVFLGKGLFTFLSTYWMKSIGHKIVKKLRDDLYTHLIGQSTKFFDHSSTGELISRVTNDTDKIQQAVSGSLADLISETFTLIVLFIGIFIIDWHLTLISLIITPLAVVPLIIFGRQQKRKGLLGQIKIAQITNSLFETITGSKIVKAFNMERFEIMKFLKRTYEHFKINLKLALIGSLSSPFMELIGGIAAAFILIVGTRKITRGEISPGDFGAFLTAIFMMYTPIKRLSRANNTIQQGLAGLERVQELLAIKPEIVESPDAYPLPLVKGEVQFKNVYFSYNQASPVLKGINLKVLPGELVALVGLSGAGKTTIINLIPRFYDVTSGSITIDNINIKEVTFSSLRSQIGLVTQDTILFNDTVKNNIAYGLENVSMSKIIEASKAAMAHEFIQKLPQGYDTYIGEKGQLLSTGQRQRLTIARAILKNSPILILDEATSALDSESERLVQIALNNLMKNKTTFVIAHRLSTVRKADKIVVIDKGKIVEMGTHHELLKKGGLYSRLYALQFLDEK